MMSRLVIKATAGTDAPERCAQAFTVASVAVAAGADGLIIEVHPTPDRALSDGAQTLYPEQFGRLMREVSTIATAIDRRVAPAPEGSTVGAG